MNYSNKALLTTLKRKTEQKEIFWDLQVKYTILGIKERETFAKFNQAIESGKIKTEINISWKDQTGKSLNDYASEVSSQKYEEKITNFKPINNFKLDINAITKSAEKLLNRVRERNLEKEKYAQMFLKEWQEMTFKNPLIAKHEIEQSVKFVYENELFKQGLVKKAVPYQEYILPSEIEEFIKGVEG